MPPSIFSHITHSVGALVFVDPQSRTGRPNSEGGKAWVQAVNNENGTLDVKYLVGRRNRVSLGVMPNRVHVDSLGTTARRTRERQNPMPSQLSADHNENTTNAAACNANGTDDGSASSTAESRHDGRL